MGDRNRGRAVHGGGAAATTRADPELLLAVFRFKHQRPNATQSESFCWRLRDAVGKCIDETVVDTNGNGSGHETDISTAHLDPEWDDHATPLGAFTPQERVWLRRGWNQLFGEPSHRAVGDVWTLQWFPAYGAVLQAERVGIATVALRVLALDGWEWTRHFLTSGDCVDSAVPTKHVVFSCGQIPTTLLGDAQAKIKDAMAAAAQLTGNQRSAASATASGVTGHQKTPQFLVASVWNVLDDLAETHTKNANRSGRMPRGGMTDVGLHTGGAARDTCWPLVCAALRQALPKFSVLFDKVLLVFHGWLLESGLPVDGKRCLEETSVQAFWRNIEECFEMLETVVDSATRLEDDGYDTNGIVRNCENWRKRIDTVASEWSHQQADNYRLSPASPEQRKTPMMEYPKLAAPDQKPFAIWQTKAKPVYANPVAHGNSEYVLLEDDTPRSAVSILVFLESIEPQHKAKALFGVRMIEKFLFKLATTLNEPVSRDVLAECEPEPLLDMMDWYRDHAMGELPLCGDDIRRVQRQSVYTVLAWVAFCLAHRHTCGTFADVGQHKIALDWQDLQVCVLHEASSRSALLHVVRYIHDWNARAESGALFDLERQEGTLALARRMGQSVPIYQDIYLEAVSRLRLVCECQWAGILARKRNLELVRQEIASFTASLNELKHHLAAAEDALRWEWKSRHPKGKPPRYLSNYQTQVFSEEIYRLTDLVRQKTAYRDELVQMPEFTVSPVPADQEEALQILFLLGPPKPIDNLAGLCWWAQRALTPPSSGRIERPLSGSSWRSHVEGIVGELPFADSAQYLAVLAGDLEIPSSFGPSTIDDVATAEMYTHSCVWYPSGSGTTVLWRDDTSQEEKYVNPFQVTLPDSIQFFTPELPGGESPRHTDKDAKREQSWRWIISYPGDSGPERGNLTYAERSTSVEKDGDNEQRVAAFSILGSLRAYPTQQLRRIFSSVAGDSLAWSDNLVGTILLQALYQVGIISVSAASETSTALFLWHRDLANDTSVHHFSTALKRVIEQVKLSPRCWNCIPLLSEMAAFLCQYDSDNAKPLLFVLARISRRWARETRDEWQRDSVLEEERRQLRSHECILYGYGVLCLDYHCAYPSLNEVEELCELLVLFHHARLFAVGDQAAEVESLASRIDWMMANRVITLVKAVDGSPHKRHLLTRLAKSVLPKISDQVNWRLIQAGRSRGGMSCCFIGVNDSDGSTCVINLFSGAVTSSGGHPISLPQSIRCFPQYQTLFQEREFEVVYAKGVYETTAHNEHSRQYRFCVFPENATELFVEEAGSDYTLQSCAITWTDQLQRVLPTRLAKLYSHWYWMKRQIVLLRGLRASDTGVYYVMRFDVDGTTRCYEVPRQDRFVKYSLLVKRLREYPMVVVGDAKVVATLSKFEEAQYIHTLRQPQSPHALEVSLPRFGLRFVRDADGRLASLSHRGYVLSEHQQLAGQMLGFRQYLLLHNCESELGNLRLLVPMGPVRASGKDCEAGLVVIHVSSDPAASLSFLTIDQHPRLEVFTPETIEARLQLAAIYAASGTRLPWPQLRMTGGEAALQMLRGCVPSRPFSSVACEHLTTIASRFTFRTPVLAIVAGLLLEKSQRLAFLFDEQPPMCPTVQYADALDEYRHQHGSPHTARQVSVRQRLAYTELCDIVGSVAAAGLVPAGTFVRRDQIVGIDFGEEPGEQLFMKKLEHGIASIASPSTSSSTHEEETVPVPPFPLSPHGSNTMSNCMLQDLRESWNTYHRHSWHAASTHVSAEAVRECARRLRCDVTAEIQRLQQTLREVLRRSSTSVCDRLATTVSRPLDLTFADVMRSVVDEEFLRQVVPYFTRADRDKWKVVCIQLLEVCVLEDKLERISLGRLDSDVQDELRTATRAWDSNEHPYWLVFEVENRMQIRHEQYVIAKHLMDNPGSICQLNMGRGKTRVILPMLFLYFSFATRSKSSSPLNKLTRTHFLSPLLSETRELMWKVLTSSVLALPFIELPYNRSCSLTPDDVAMIRHVLSEAKRHGAVLMVAPEHRLSLELERVELQHRHDEEVTDQIVDALGEILDPTDFIDVFDESDALLHHGYHLVYAVGASKALDGGATRWLMAEALLRVLVSGKSKRVQQTLQRYPDAWSIQPEYKERFGGGIDGDTSIYNGFRLHIASSTETNGEQMRAALRTALAEDLMDDPPFELEWLRLFGSRTGGVRKSLVRLLTDVSVDAMEAMQRLPPAILHVKDYVLALRGLLAFNVLETCLQKRYRVEYGHPPAASRQKAIAIPFQAADLPAERSEFSHPDVGITLTLLAFYHLGLSDAQVHQAFEVLLSLDESESRRYYDEWFGSITSQIEDHEHRDMLASLQHISTDNAHQFVVVCRAFRFAMEVINFYVNFCVFPRDTRQFPHRLSRSAWDLVRGQRNIGFSGTKDTHYLLPHGVDQHEPDEPVLRGTNGNMVQLLLAATRGYEALSGSGQDGPEQQMSSRALACWQSLLLSAVAKHTHALIDTGALLAGVSNHEAAAFLVAHATFAFQGVTYYDTRPQFDAWVVLEKDRDLIHLHKNSPLRESDTFVIFDEARARGSDMKLSHQAVALLTLGPSITKDKLMQGAGRMRLLGAHQQTLWLTSTQDVYKSVAFQAASTKPIDVVAVLNWVMDNTQRQCTLGLLEWAQSGIQFHTKQAHSAHELQDDDWTLQGQYGAAQTQRLIAEIIQSKLDKQSDLLQGRYGETAEVMAHVQRHGETFGRQDAVHVANFDEECERELQIEEERQETREHSRHHVAPCTERAWNWRSLLHADSIDSFRAQANVGIDILSLEDAVRAWLVPLACGELDWGATNLFATANFWSTVAVVENAESTDHNSSKFVWTSCMREVHSLVVFADSSILMLSEFEENAVLAMLYAGDGTVSTGAVRDETSIDTPTIKASGAAPGCFGVVHLPFAVDYIERLDATSSPSASRNTLRVLLRDVPLASGWNKGRVAVATRLVVPLIAVIACCLLNGDTELFVGCHTTAAESALRTLLASVRHREETLQTFISLRGFTGRWKRSSLHAIARRMDLEDTMRPTDTIKPNKAKPKKKRGKKKCAVTCVDVEDGFTLGDQTMHAI